MASETPSPNAKAAVTSADGPYWSSKKATALEAHRARMLRMPSYLEALKRLKASAMAPLPRFYDCHWSMRESLCLGKFLYLKNQVKNSEQFCQTLLDFNQSHFAKAMRARRKSSRHRSG